MAEPRPPTLLVAGGASGGHVHAGIAVAEKWRERYGPSARVAFVGAKGRIEERIVPRAGFPLHLLRIGSLNRVGAARKLLTLVQIPFSIAHAFCILMRERPRAVLGVGGFPSGPVILAASILRPLARWKLAVLEQNSVPGLTNRIVGRLSQAVFAVFEGLEGRFDGTPVQVTGNPIRSEFRKLPPAPRDPFTVFVFGGSQGASGINTKVIEALPFLKGVKLRFIHQTGPADRARVGEAYAAAGLDADVRDFFFDMADQYARASIVICRAGASTIAELSAVGRAAVLVPLPTAADDHQEKNARALESKGAARVFRQEGSGRELASIILELQSNPSAAAAMESAVSCFWRPNAAQDIVQALEKL